MGLHRIAHAVLIGATLLGAVPSQAQQFPSQPIRMLVPVSPGGTTDIIARAIATRLQEAWKQPVVVENRAGGSGIVAAEIVAKAKPDGHTMLMGTFGTLTVNASLFQKLPYNTLRDFAPITLVAATPNILVVHPSVPVKTVQDLIALAKAAPGKLNYASSGSGTSPHLGGELFKMLAGVDMVHVPYKGGAPAEMDLLAGHVQVMFDNMITALPYVRAGRMRGIAVTGKQRSKLFPELPTIAEAGLPGYEISGWIGLVVPVATPANVIAAIHAEMVRVLALPDIQERILGSDPVGSSPEAFGEFLRSETEKWAKVVAAAGIRAD